MWVMLLVAASLLPWTVALACAHQVGLIQQHCCCVGQRGPCPQIVAGVGACCQIVIATPSQLADSQLDVVPPSDGGKSLGPPPSILGAISDAFPARPAVTWVPHARAWFSGSNTYLQTARLRL